MSKIYVRKKGAKTVHLQAEDGSTRCFPGRYDTSDWERLEPSDELYPRLCMNCLKTPSDAETYFDAVETAKREREAIYRATKPTRRLE